MKELILINSIFTVILLWHQLAGWFLANIIRLVSSSSISQTFSTDFKNFLFLFWAFCRKWKKWKTLVLGLMIIVDGVEQTSLNPIFFPNDYCWMWPGVIMGKHDISPIDECGRFLKRFSCFHAYIAVVKNVGQHWVSDYCLKTQKE